MWDLGGQDSLRAAWNTYYTDTEVPTWLLLIVLLNKRTRALLTVVRNIDAKYLVGLSIFA